MIRGLFRKAASDRGDPDPLKHVRGCVLTVRDFRCLKRAMGWTRDPVLLGDYLHAFEYLEDLNDRRLRDAEVVGGACCNADPRTLLEIGTGLGRTTALMARNAPRGTVHTVNILPGEIAEGGSNVTFAPTREEIGRCYREEGLTNVRQIFANTRRWAPDIGPVDVAFIDGCHDADDVYEDTRKILGACHSGSIVLWHDFAPDLAPVYHWITEVCRGVDRLIADGLIQGRILHLQDSWVGVHRVP